MKRILQAIGLICVLAVATLAGGIGYTIHVARGLDQESQAYTDQAVQAVTANWSIAELRARAAPALLQNTKPDDLQNLFVVFSKLGPLQTYLGSKGTSIVSVTTGAGKVITANYTAQAKYQNGTAEIEIGLIKIGNDWKIQGFRVSSSDMLRQTVGQGI